MKKWMLIAVLWTSFSATMFGVTHIYSGRYAYASETLYTWDGKSLYKGNSCYSSDILYTFDGKHVYRGRSSYSSDILYTYDGSLPIPILMMVI
jgi:hypothetical protein